MSVAAKCSGQQKIGVNKMLAWTKYSRWQNVGLDKLLASTKYSGQQNIDVDKMLVLTKCWRQQNIRVNKMLAHALKHLLTVLAWQSPQQLTSHRTRWCSPTSPRTCWTLHVQSPSVLLPLAAWPPPPLPKYWICTHPKHYAQGCINHRCIGGFMH
jgi:hypothetical protein